MKTAPFKLASSFWPILGVGCVLALAPAAAFAQGTDPAIYTASQSQATDPMRMQRVRRPFLLLKGNLPLDRHPICLAD